MNAPAPPAVPHVMAALRAGRFAQALTLAEEGLAAPGPDPAPLLALAGLAAQRAGEPARAAGHLRSLLAIKPDDLATRSNLARALVDAGDCDAALEVAAGSEHPPLARIEGFVRQKRGEFEAAAAAYARVLAREPNDVASLNNLGNVLAKLGEVDEAIARFERAITIAPQEIGIYLNLAQVLREADRSGPRLKVMQDAAAIMPNDRAVMTELALAHAHHEQFEPALALLEDICRRFPAFGESQLELGRMYESFNRIDDLAALVAGLGDDAPPEAGFLRAWLALRLGKFDEAAAAAQAIRETIDPMRRWHLVGSIEERRGNAAAAFAAFARMNAGTIAAVVPADADTYRESVARRTAAWTQGWAARWRRPALPADAMRDPIFLVGFPRSGTTLLDTMLMGMPGLSVLEERPMIAQLARRVSQEDLPELPVEDIVRLRREYRAIAADHGADGAAWLVDKQPLNMTHVPLIHRLFPAARLILAERHPYDVVLSCFMANFQPNFAMRSFLDLEEAARTYDAVFTAWERAITLLALPYRAVRYERLVADPAGELAPLAEWLGIAWSDALADHTGTARARGRVRTASYAQIGEPLYTRARDRWRRYAEQLAPVLPILEPWARRLGYETE